MIRACTLLTLAACAEDLSLETDPSEDSDPVEDSDSAGFPWLTLTTEGSDHVAVIDTTDAAVWRHLDLIGDQGLEPTDPGTDPTWTLAASRFNVVINGGVSGPAGIEAVFLEGVALADAVAPADGWITDRADENGDGKPELALAWYNYDPSTHVLSPKDGTWMLRGGRGAVALRFEDYYDEAGNSGFLAIRWR